MAILLNTLTDSFGVELTQDGSAPAMSADSIDLEELLQRARVVVGTGKDRSLLPLSKHYRVATDTVRTNVECDSYTFWHFDAAVGRFITLMSGPNDMQGQPHTLFADLDDVVSHLVDLLPGFIDRLNERIGDQTEVYGSAGNILADRGAGYAFDLAVNRFELYDTLPYLSDLKRNRLSILRDASVAFLELLNGDPSVYIDEYTKVKRTLPSCDGFFDVEENRLLLYGRMVESFLGYDFVADFLERAHDVPSRYLHIWQPSQTVAWSGEDKRLVHAMIPNPSPSQTILHLLRVQYTFESRVTAIHF